MHEGGLKEGGKKTGYYQMTIRLTYTFDIYPYTHVLSERFEIHKQDGVCDQRTGYCIEKEWKSANERERERGHSYNRGGRFAQRGFISNRAIPPRMRQLRRLTLRRLCCGGGGSANAQDKSDLVRYKLRGMYEI